MLWVRIVLLHTPPLVWVVLALLLFLGIRRLKARRVHLAAAALPTFAFLLMSLASARFLAADYRAAAALGAGLSGLLGAWGARLRRTGQPVHVEGWWFDRPGSVGPLAAYMLLFVLHYGLAIWAGFVPALSGRIGFVRLLVSAASAGWSIAGLAACRRKIQSHDRC
jgi:hypothetical protein